jgi:hypothetical protein
MLVRVGATDSQQRNLEIEVICMSPALGENLPEVLKNFRVRPLFQLREQVPPLYIVGQTPNAFPFLPARQCSAIQAVQDVFVTRVISHIAESNFASSLLGLRADAQGWLRQAASEGGPAPLT